MVLQEILLTGLNTPAYIQCLNMYIINNIYLFYIYFFFFKQEDSHASFASYWFLIMLCNALNGLYLLQCTFSKFTFLLYFHNKMNAMTCADRPVISTAYRCQMWKLRGYTTETHQHPFYHFDALHWKWGMCYSIQLIWSHRTVHTHTQ